MKKHLLAAAAATGLLFAGWHWFGLRAIEAPVPHTAGTPLGAGSEELARVRRSASLEALDHWIRTQRERTSPADASGLRTLAEALLERALAHASHKGMRPGEPVFTELPAAVAQDLDAAENALRAARQAGDDSAETYRIEAAVLGNRITGFASALQLNGRIEAALREAVQRDPQHPRIQVALGCRYLFAPALLGRDLARARQHLEAGANALPLDERPLLFLALLAELEGNRAEAVTRLEQALARNPHSRYAQTVLARLRGGEPDAFGRDV